MLKLPYHSKSYLKQRMKHISQNIHDNNKRNDKIYSI